MCSYVDDLEASRVPVDITYETGEGYLPLTTHSGFGRQTDHGMSQCQARRVRSDPSERKRVVRTSLEFPPVYSHRKFHIKPREV